MAPRDSNDCFRNHYSEAGLKTRGNKLQQGLLPSASTKGKGKGKGGQNGQATVSNNLCAIYTVLTNEQTAPAAQQAAGPSTAPVVNDGMGEKDDSGVEKTVGYTLSSWRAILMVHYVVESAQGDVAGESSAAPSVKTMKAQKKKGAKKAKNPKAGESSKAPDVEVKDAKKGKKGKGKVAKVISRDEGLNDAQVVSSDAASAKVVSAEHTDQTKGASDLTGHDNNSANEVKAVGSTSAVPEVAPVEPTEAEIFVASPPPTGDASVALPSPSASLKRKRDDHEWEELVMPLTKEAKTAKSTNQEAALTDGQGSDDLTARGLGGAIATDAAGLVEAEAEDGQTADDRDATADSTLRAHSSPSAECDHSHRAKMPLLVRKSLIRPPSTASSSHGVMMPTGSLTSGQRT